jgi:hypothetical protein
LGEEERAAVSAAEIVEELVKEAIQVIEKSAQLVHNVRT